MPTRELIISGPSLEITHNGEEAIRERTLTIAIEAADRQQVVRVVFPKLTSAQLRCWGETLVEAADLADNDRFELSATRNFKVAIKDEA